MSIVKNKMRRTSVAACAILVLAYAFFFTSKFTFPAEITEKSSVTQIGATEEYMTGRTCTVISAVYSKEQEMMEVVMNLTNTTGDGINDYYSPVPLVVSGMSKNAVAHIVINERLLTVVRVEGLKSYKELFLIIAPKFYKDVNKIGENEEIVLTLNKHNVEHGTIDTGKSKNDYLLDRLRSIIKNREDDINEAENNLKDKEETIRALKTDSEQIEKNMVYMSPEEKEQALSQIATNAETELRLTEEIAEDEKNITQLKQSLVELNGQVKELENGS